MIGSVFLETYKQTWKQMLYWGLGLAAIGLLVVLMVPLFDMNDMRELMENFPPFVLALVGIDPSSLEIFTTNEGFVAISFFGKSALIFAVYPVVMGMRITANDEDEGIMDVLLSLPVPRIQVVIEKFAAYTVSVIGVVAVIYLSMYFGVAISGVDLDMSRLTEVIFYLIPVMVFVMAVTMFVAVIVRRRQVALGIVTAFIIVSFMLQTIGTMATDTIAESIGQISFFTYYNASNILADGFIWSHIIGLIGLSLALLVFSLYSYERRDVGI